MKYEQVEKNAQTALLSCLRDIPFLRVERIERECSQDGQTPDIRVELELPEGEQLMVCEVKSSGQPKMAREAANQILRYRQTFPEAYGVLVAPWVARGTADVCSSEGIGYVDLAGNCRLSFGQVFIQREGRPNPFAQRRDLRSLYSPKAARVLRVLLNNPGKPWKVQPLAKEARVSVGQVANVKRLLLDREWVRHEPEGFSLIEPGALLEEWTESYTFRRNEVRDFYSLQSPAEVESNLAEVCRRADISCALTGFSGAARLAPFVRYQRVTAYVDGDIADIAADLGLREVSSGANVSLWVPYDEGVFYATREIDGHPVVSPVQLYLDLNGLRGRGEEAASFLLEEVIKPRW